ncbi:hypothetical protein Psi01_05450 [Planobispora siamensis]|uniref:Uncharacterized protein n=2 Tax=Planobispora siamensis TaxID=936338 RepID=A0A8J3WHY0_9ACTN|nr:hypothetical protein Psi01_05450 [Planobispora siamensis]
MMSRRCIDALRTHAQAAYLIDDAGELAGIVTELVAELQGSRIREGLIRSEYLALLTAARATIAAERCHQAAPLTFLHWELERHGQLPGDHDTATRVLADAKAAQILMDHLIARQSPDNRRVCAECGSDMAASAPAADRGARRTPTGVNA